MYILLGAAGLGLAELASANMAKLQWDPVDDDRVGFYELSYWNPDSGFERTVETASTLVTVRGLKPGYYYEFAVRACTEDGTLCSDFSNTESATCYWRLRGCT